MASIAIVGAAPSIASQSVGNPKTASAQPETAIKAPATLKPDTVKLSPAAQAKMMHRAGQSPSLIAATLGTNIAAVDGYLSIKVAAQAAPAPVAAPAEHDSPQAQAPGTQPAPKSQSTAPAATPAPATAETPAPEAESVPAAVIAKG